MQLESCPVRHPLHRRREGGGPLDFTRSGSGQRVRQFVNGEARTDRDSDTGGEVRRRPGRAPGPPARTHPPHTPDGPAAAHAAPADSPGSAACEKRSALKTNRASTRKTLIHAPLGVTAHTPGGRPRRRHRFRPQPRRRGPIGTTDVTRVIAPPPQGESAADPHINRSGSARTPSPALRTILYRLRGAHVTEHIGLERRPAHRPGPCRQRQSLARHTAQCVHPSRPW